MDQQGFAGMFVLCVALSCAATHACALDLEFPVPGTMVHSAPPEAGGHPFAIGPWASGQVPTDLAVGAVQTSTWQVAGEGVSSLSLFASLQDQVVDQGYEIVFACAAATCGGYDFRHALPLGQAPEMFIDLGDFHYLSARLGGTEGLEHLALTVSSGGGIGFVHLALVQPQTEVAPPVIQSSRAPDALPVIEEPLSAEPPPAVTADDLIGMLTARGSAPLTDLRFDTGASTLSGDRYASLVALAEFLAEDAERRIMLVGHTDATGSLDGNIALSRARAEAVRRFLLSELDVRPAQVDAQGIGFLAPRAPNSTPEGRDANRRVEVVLINPT